VSARLFQQGQTFFISDVYSDYENGDPKNDQRRLHGQKSTKRRRGVSMGRAKLGRRQKVSDEKTLLGAFGETTSTNPPRCAVKIVTVMVTVGRRTCQFFAAFSTGLTKEYEINSKTNEHDSSYKNRRLYKSTPLDADY